MSNLEINKSHVDVGRRVALRRLEEYKSNPTVNGVKFELSEIENKTLTVEDVHKMRGNSYVWANILPRLNDEALIERVYNYLGNITSIAHGACTTYEESLVNLIVPEMIDRLNEYAKPIVANDSIFDALVKFLKENDCSLIRINIKEDENFGEAIIQRQDGTPVLMHWHPVEKEWC